MLTMAVLLYKLRGVPDDEADEMRTLLQENNIDFYETNEGNWGISMPAFWLNDKSQLEFSKNILNEYQKERQQKSRQAYDNLKKNNQLESFVDSVRVNPIGFIVTILVIILVLYISIAPFISISK